MLPIVDSGSRSRRALAAMLVLVCSLALPAAQTREEPPKNPFQPNPTILQEGMAATQKADEEPFHYVNMAHDDFSNLRSYTLKIFTEPGYLRLNVGHFIIPSDKKYCLICSR